MLNLVADVATLGNELFVSKESVKGRLYKPINTSMVYLVTWDLNKEKWNYTEARRQFLENLYRYEHIKERGLDSVVFVSTDWSASQIDADLRTKMDDDDRLIVTKLVSGHHQGWLHEDIWEWINARL